MGRTYRNTPTRKNKRSEEKGHKIQPMEQDYTYRRTIGNVTHVDFGRKGLSISPTRTGI